MFGFIYLTTNLINGKIYIGQHELTGNSSIDDNYLGSGTLIVRAIKKYGRENFIRSILRECKTKRELNNWEKLYIKRYKSQDREIGYNIADGDILDGRNNPAHLPEVREKIRALAIKRYSNPSYVNPNIGRKFTEEQKKKMSEAQKGEKSWMWGRRGKLCHNYGRKVSVSTRLKLSLAARGKTFKMTDEQRKKISEHHHNVSGENNPMYGKRGKLSPMFGRKWITNGKICKFIDISNGIPQGFRLGRK